MKKFIQENKISLILWGIFEIVAVSLFCSTSNIFYLLNFTYIGTCIALGIFLLKHQRKYARNFVQIGIGLYMLVYVGLICRENMQIEGFWYYLFLGVFEAATMHYLIAKILGPIVFGRWWCGYACWTGMILDLLPYKVPQGERKKWVWGRYIMFFLSITFVASLFIFQVPEKETILFYAFIIGNVVYYLVGILLAWICKDNRAFCKYLCPVTIFLKPMSYFSFLRVKCDHDTCIHCKKCIEHCPMNVDMIDDSRKRCNGTECILCAKCINACPMKALKLTFFEREKKRD